MLLQTTTKNEHRELGKVTWNRNYDLALQDSAESGKPVLLLFQEIPGCSTCVNFGRDVLSHPLMVEVIENEFIPLAIFNNVPGKDNEILRSFNEPAWNNPVSYFLDKDGNSIVSKLANNYHPLSMYNKIYEVLLKTKGNVPEYFKILGGDLKIDYGYATKTFYETPCFWSGETTLAHHDQILSTQPGFIGPNEVVEVYYDQESTNKSELDAFAAKQGFFTIPEKVFRIDKDPQFYLKKTAYKYLPLSRGQRTQINRAIPYEQDPKQFLSPKQLYWLNHSELSQKGDPENYTRNISSAWDKMNQRFKVIAD